jgi:hypothetical protein
MDMEVLEEISEKGPKGEGPVGVKVPTTDTAEHPYTKGVPADEQEAGTSGDADDAGQPGVSLGALTQDAHSV